MALGRKIYFLAILCCASLAVANPHRPVLVLGEETRVEAPGISQAFYGVLKGKSHKFVFSLQEDSEVYIGLLVPYLTSAPQAVSATLIDTHTQTALRHLDGNTFSWRIFVEPYAHDTYWQGPEIRTALKKGQYQVEVLGNTNEEKYALAIGEIESFPIQVILQTLVIVPQLKREFFEKSPADFLLSPFGLGYLIFMHLLSALLVLIYRVTVRKVSQRQSLQCLYLTHTEKLVFGISGLSSLFLTVTTSWHPIMLLGSSCLSLAALLSTKIDVSKRQLRS